MFDSIQIALNKIAELIILLAIAITGLATEKPAEFQLGNAQLTPSIEINGKATSFDYTDDNTGENFIIHADKEFYHPLWAWNGFDVYVAVKNESGVNQTIDLQPFFNKNFSMEQVSVLDPTATSTFLEPIYEDVCGIVVSTTTMATSTECHKKKTGDKEVILLGVWSPINVDAFSLTDYQQLISDNNITVKSKEDRTADYKFSDYILKNQTKYYKIGLKSNEPFSQEEFDLEIIGDKGGYSLLDPTIFTDNFNTYNNGDLNGQGSWSGNTTYDVQSTTYYDDGGTKAVQFTNTASQFSIEKAGTQQTAGTVGMYMRKSVVNNGQQYFLAQEDTWDGYTIFAFMHTGAILFNGNTTLLDPFVVDTWYWVQMEWKSDPDHLVRGRYNDNAWSDWIAPQSDWVTGLGEVNFTVNSLDSDSAYYDFIAEASSTAPVVAAEEADMSVIIIN